eukprot:g17334.t1
MVDKAAKLRALAGVRESDMLGSSSSTHEDLHGSPVFDRLNELSTKLNRLMTDLQMIRQEIERRLEEDTRPQGGTRPKDHDDLRYGATSSGSLTAMTLEGLLERGKGLCEQIKNVIHELEQNQLRARTPSEKQSCASSLKVAGETFKASLLDFIDLEGRYRDHIDDRVEDSRRRTLQLDSARPAVMRWFGQRQLQKTPEYRGKRAKLQELENQHAAMLQFEQQVTELHDIVLYMDAMCEAQERDQRDVLETIEQGVDNTLSYAGDGLVKLEEAEVHKESYDTKRRALSWGTLSLFVIGIPVLVLLGVLLFVKM